LITPEEFDEILTQTLGVNGPAYNVAPTTKLITLPKSEWSRNRDLSRKRDESLPDNELPLDDNGKKIRPPPPVPFMWPKHTAYYSPKEEETKVKKTISKEEEKMNKIKAKKLEDEKAAAEILLRNKK
jgi:hypothetical protein